MDVDKRGYCNIRFESRIYRYLFPDSFLHYLQAEDPEINRKAEDAALRESQYLKLLAILDPYGFEGPVHVTEFSNFKQIIRDGSLKSRKKLEDEGRAYIDKANHSVITGTLETVKEYARFYYRFNTPTHYTAAYENPVGLVFSKELLKSPDALFCTMSAAKKDCRFKKPAEAISIESWRWDAAFSTGAYEEGMRDFIVAHRNMDFLVKNEVSTSYLKKIYFPTEDLKQKAIDRLGDALKGIELLVNPHNFEGHGYT